MRPKRQVKPQKKSFFGFTRINKANEDPSQANPIYHLLTPIANARPDHPTAKFIAIFGNQILLQTGNQQAPKTVNPLYKFHIFHLVLTDYISYDFSPTTYKVTLLTDLTIYMNDQKDKDIVKAISQIASNFVVQFLQSKGTDKIAEIRKLDTRAERLKMYKELLDSEGQKYAEMYLREYAKHLEVTNRQRRLKGEMLAQEQVLVNKLYARTQIEVVKQIEPLRYHQQLQKLTHFCEIHKDFFGTELKTDKQYSPARHAIKINAPSLAAEPVLILLDDLMELREPDVDYKMEYLVMARDILSELDRYRKETHEKPNPKDHKEYKGCTNYYHYLCPQAVIVDQLTLRAKLSYQLSVRNALGLRNKPCSTENKLIFFPTPKVFDFYQSQAELEDNVNLILDDSHFGQRKMYAKINNSEDQKRIVHEKKSLQNLKQQICVDRYLLLCHRMFYNKEFGRTDVRTSKKQIKDHFSKCLKNAKARISQDPKNLSIFIDPKVHKKKLKSFDFTFDELLEFMQVDDSDSAIHSTKHLKLYTFLQLKSTIAQKMINILKDDYFFSRISNAKKYIIFFFIAGIQCLEELRAFWTVQTKQYETIPALIKDYRQGQNQKERKENRNKLKVEATLKNSLIKIEEYRTRDQNQKEDKSKSFLDDDLGKKLYDFVIKLNSKIEEYKTRPNQKIADIISQKNKLTDLIVEIKKKMRENKQEPNKHNLQVQQRQKKERSQSFQKIKKEFKETLVALDNDLQFFKEVIFEFCYFEFQLRFKDSPQRLPTYQSKQTGRIVQEYYKQVSRRFGLILKAFLTCRPDNYVIYDTILAKMLRISEEEPKYTQASMITQQSLKKERSLLFTIDDVLSYTITAPKIFKHLQVTKKMMEGHFQAIKDESVFLNSKLKNPNKYPSKEEDQHKEREEDRKLPVQDKFSKSMEWI